MLTLSGAGQPQNGVGIEKRFVISVKTDNAGTSADNEFTLPTTGTGYNYDIEYDGQTLTGQTGSVTLTFPSGPGTYDIKISGSFPQCRFGGDRLKLLEIKNFGIYALGSTDQSRAFVGCSNMDISATDIGHFENVTDFSSAFLSCSSLTSFPAINVNSATSLNAMFRVCTNLVSIDVSGWDVSNVTRFDEVFMYNYSLTSINVENWNTSSGVNFKWMFFLSNNLTFSNSLNWDTSNATNFTDMFRGNTLNISLDSLDINNVTAFGSNFANFPSVSDYNATLISWAAQTPRLNQSVNFGSSQYTYEAAAARQTLIDTYGWTITDGGGI